LNKLLEPKFEGVFPVQRLPRLLVFTGLRELLVRINLS